MCGWLWVVGEKGGQRLAICGLTGFNFDFSFPLNCMLTSTRRPINSDHSLSWILSDPAGIQSPEAKSGVFTRTSNR